MASAFICDMCGKVMNVRPDYRIVIHGFNAYETIEKSYDVCKSCYNKPLKFVDK